MKSEKRITQDIKKNDQTKGKKPKYDYSEMVALADIIIDSFLESRRKENQKVSI